jgi:alpha-tubulin suppressor-like RCC1 family protein
VTGNASEDEDPWHLTAVKKPEGVSFTQVSVSPTSLSYNTDNPPHVLAVGSDGNVYAWGSNEGGQLGNGTTENSNVPVRVSKPADVKFSSVAAGNRVSYALTTTGKAYAWGDNSIHAFGNDTTESSSVPVPVTMPAGVSFTQVVAGADLSGTALGDDGNVYVWGENHFESLGVKNDVAAVPVRVPMPAGLTFTQVSKGINTGAALDQNGNAYMWGSNHDAELGTGDIHRARTPVPVKMPDGATFTKITCGSESTFAIGSDGKTYAWGYDYYGRLGTGSKDPDHIPVPSPVVVTPAGISFTSVTSRASGSIALGSDKNLYWWGTRYDNPYFPFANSYTPKLATGYPFPVTGVTFDGVEGTNLTANGDGTVTVTAPAHAAGAVDVKMSWKLAGIAQAPITYSKGFTYITSPGRDDSNGKPDTKPGGGKPETTSGKTTNHHVATGKSTKNQAVSGKPAPVSGNHTGKGSEGRKLAVTGHESTVGLIALAALALLGGVASVTTARLRKNRS